MSPTLVAAYLALFFAIGAMFLFTNLLIGRFLRPKNPNEEKLSVYECGEPTIGSSFVQFDLRFYVIALLFIIFDVEVAFFFPWAAAFGKSTHLTDPKFAVVSNVSETDSSVKVPVHLTPKAAQVQRELGVANPTVPDSAASVAKNEEVVRGSAALLAKTSIGDILVFFAVLMVGFAYVWSRGDLDWVRALQDDHAQTAQLRAVGVDEGADSVLAG
ncbi:MAG: NADH-quinone oxidoreductase subunit A [Planctomycetia bacterium]|nr:NADH-quinone oxidoreductase subunit A [Planctomycetia bacterium]